MLCGRDRGRRGGGVECESEGGDDGSKGTWKLFEEGASSPSEDLMKC